MMNVKTKLFVGFGTLMFLMFALAGIGINRLSTIDESMKEIYSNRYLKVHMISELRDNTTSLARNVANLLMIDDPAGSAKTIGDIRSFESKMSQSLERIDAENKGELEQPLLWDVTKPGKKFLQYADDVISLYQGGRKAEAVAMRTSIGVAAQEDLLNNITAMTQYQEGAMAKALKQAELENSKTYNYTALIAFITLLIGAAIMFWLVLSMTRGLGLLSVVMNSFKKGQGPGSYRIPIKTSDEFGRIARTFNEIAEELEESTVNERQLSQLNAEQAWLQANIAHISTELQSIQRLDTMADRFINELCRIIGAQSGAFYVSKQEGMERSYTLLGTYAFVDSAAVREIVPGQGLIGQCALDGQPITTNTPSDYSGIRSAFGEIASMTLAVRPIIYLNEIIAVFEVSAVKPFNELEIKMMDHLCNVAAVTLHRIKAQTRVEELLRISQLLTDELQSQSVELLSQQDELRASNEKLEEQTRALQSSEELLQRQQGELEQSNEELLRKTKLLEVQVRETEEINRQIELAKDALEKQALELNLASKYKSEFMANMSHELRTPLNSMLILSQLFKENKDGNLSEKQVEYAETIFSSGSDLLKLIDNILDLTKAESGRMQLQPERVLLRNITESLNKSFTPVSLKKKLEYNIQVDGQTPPAIFTDSMRLLQILKNLLSNAFKFTNQGSVTLHIGPIKQDPFILAFSVEDTGIGILETKQQMIFEAFQQADGTTSRQYGGTGLGLSISKQLAGLLGGSIVLESELGKGSKFTLLLPLTAFPVPDAGQPKTAVAASPMPAAEAAASAEPLETFAKHIFKVADQQAATADDRDSMREGDRVLLIIEGDVHFAGILMEMARSHGFKALVALQGDIGLQMAQQYKPDAILLDIQLPVIDGWSILVHLKNEADTRHIPVHVLSVGDQVQQGLAMGAIAYLQKPSDKDNLEEAFAQIEAFLDKGSRKLLFVGQDDAHRRNLIELIDHDDVQIIDTPGGTAAWDALQEQTFDCMVIDMGPDDLSYFELLERIKTDEKLSRLPIVIYTAQDWGRKDQLKLKKYAESIIIKNVKTPERLLDETALFLHRIEENLPEEKRQMLRKLHSKEEVFAGKRVLVVDDDIRNVFALSNLLEGYDMHVSFAETGKQALERLKEKPGYDLVLMDIMMPEMDGYEAMREIRKLPEYEQLPIIALTAKAMRDDREKCIQAGASDYITKPIHTEQLLSLIRVWLCQ